METLLDVLGIIALVLFILTVLGVIDKESWKQFGGWAWAKTPPIARWALFAVIIIGLYGLCAFNGTYERLSWDARTRIFFFLLSIPIAFIIGSAGSGAGAPAGHGGHGGGHGGGGSNKNWALILLALGVVIVAWMGVVNAPGIVQAVNPTTVSPKKAAGQKASAGNTTQVIVSQKPPEGPENMAPVPVEPGTMSEVFPVSTKDIMYWIYLHKRSDNGHVSLILYNGKWTKSGKYVADLSHKEVCDSGSAEFPRLPFVQLDNTKGRGSVDLGWNKN
ncbi:MAG: hypothetical protein PHV42_00090 [Candidatus Pacebacteria bacterium]|nr:hypothetical protein [Candidatus Paceibacterota bacterium]